MKQGDPANNQLWQYCACFADRLSFTGAAEAQVASVVARVEEVVARHPEAASYRPAVRVIPKLRNQV
ncbi:hypothetical protein [Acrocarpospora catenulata]|uniref:hypothetical protein n=1 Tax=Acrocarpospora catenulata TaxID=2836182 RepID=UPI001BDAC54B|nr:hypothetical protein [Acrocarpospora catenulata]